jgi:G3E family GTPase
LFEVEFEGGGKKFLMIAPMSRKLALIGGFLGAGKTTLIQRFAGWLTVHGLRPALVANDQGQDLIDTATFVAAGQSPVAEVTGGCFCCRLDEFVSVLRRMEAELRPGVIIAEPVGSCTDLMATVLLPLEQVYGMPLVSSPFSVVLDGRRALRALSGKRDPRDFHRDVGYIYRKQMEEAEWLVVNKTDLISAEQLAALQQRLTANFPDKRVFPVSGKSGEGLEAWFAALISERSGPGRTMEVDYERYGRGEAMLGWYNADVSVEFEVPTGADGWLLETSAAISVLLAEAGCKVAHFKTTLESRDGRSRVHQVMDGDGLSLADSHAGPVVGGRLLVNLRAEGSPGELDRAVGEVLGRQAGLSFSAKAAFQPGQPEPTHRVTLGHP